MRTVDVFIEIIKSVLNHDKSIDLPSDINWAEIYKLAQEQNISSLVYDGLVSLKANVGDALLQRWEQDYTQQMVFDITQSYEYEWLLEVCKENKIKVMPLKGCIFKNLYEKREYRSMGDIDFLFDPSDAQKLRDILEDRGYTCVDFNTYHHDKYEIPPLLVLEPHRTLVSPENSKWYDYFCKGFEFGHPLEDNPYHYIMDEIPCFLFYLAHFKSHFSKMGAGIRFVMDYHVMKQQWSEQLAYNKLKPYLDQLELLDFYHQVEALDNYWFGDGKTPVPQDLQEYILGNGVFGSRDQWYKNKVEKQGKVKYFVSLMFPPLYYMK